MSIIRIMINMRATFVSVSTQFFVSFFILIPFSILICKQALAEDAVTDPGAVILLYHHISDSTPAPTSISPELFEQHLDYLEKQGFQVISTTHMLESIKQGKTLAPKSIALHFDDAYESVYTQAFPLLKARNWPFSIYVATEAIDRQYRGYMTWEQLADVADYGAEIGGHTLSHAHLVRSVEGETPEEWLERVSHEIDLGNRRIEEQLDIKISLFAYPYGEFNDPLKELIKARSLYGLAQNSGAVGEFTDFYAVPRYPMASNYARMERFSLVANSKALPVTDIEAGELIRKAGDSQGVLTLRLAEGDYQVQNLACYSSTGQPLDIQRNVAELRISLPEFYPGRNKVNCTAPSATESGVYYWFSHQWIVQTADGKWAAE